MVGIGEIYFPATFRLAWLGLQESARATGSWRMRGKLVSGGIGAVLWPRRRLLQVCSLAEFLRRRQRLPTLPPAVLQRLTASSLSILAMTLSSSESSKIFFQSSLMMVSLPY